MSNETLFLTRNGEGRLCLGGDPGGIKSAYTSDALEFSGNMTVMEPAPTEEPKAPPRKGFDIRPFIWIGVALGIVLAVVLAIRKANKKFGKGFK